MRFALPEAGPVSLEVYDVLGRRVARLLDRDPREAGWHAVRFDATGLASGIYFYRVEMGRQRQVRKMLLVK
ncbi:MAG: T9SS C-terminal target domain-containing protein [Alphaproteobacteria bacterium]|nr:MAG: T9SS C-terminal target domain-containing protein [Alphaproteobacteria bacterium]